MNSKSSPSFNLLAPLSVSIVVITLGAAFGVLSGRGALIGMVSTCLVTLVAALIGGSRYGVSSPTGPMTAAIGAILILDQQWLSTHASDLSTVELMSLTLVFSAVILFLLTLFKVHKLVKWVPNLVVSGFVNGIALLIILAQFRSMQGGSDWILMGMTLGVALLMNRLNKNFEHQVWRIITGSLVVIVFMSVLAFFIDVPFSYIDFESNIAGIQWAWPRLNMINFETLWILLPLALELALIALLDTLLTAMIMDKKSGHKTKMTRELSGQSLSLFVVSLFGGIPGAQSTVPSMMLYQEKGHHRFSKLVLAGFCLLFTFVFAGLIQFVPLAVFGGVILKIALDVADLTSIKALLSSQKKQKTIRILVTLGTILSTVFLSLNLAVIFFTAVFVFWNGIMPKKWRIPDLTSDESEGVLDEV